MDERVKTESPRNQSVNTKARSLSEAGKSMTHNIYYVNYHFPFELLTCAEDRHECLLGHHPHLSSLNAQVLNTGLTLNAGLNYFP